MACDCDNVACRLAVCAHAHLRDTSSFSVRAFVRRWPLMLRSCIVCCVVFGPFSLFATGPVLSRCVGRHHLLPLLRAAPVCATGPILLRSFCVAFGGISCPFFGLRLSLAALSSFGFAFLAAWPMAVSFGLWLGCALLRCWPRPAGCLLCSPCLEALLAISCCLPALLSAWPLAVSLAPSLVRALVRYWPCSVSDRLCCLPGAWPYLFSLLWVACHPTASVRGVLSISRLAAAFMA